MEFTGQGKASLVRRHAQRSVGTPWGQSHAVGRGVRAAERWQSGEEEANPARAMGGCRQGLGISWLRCVHGELHAGLSLSDYRSWKGGSGLRQVWQEEGKGSGRQRRSRGKAGEVGSRGEHPALVVIVIRGQEDGLGGWGGKVHDMSLPEPDWPRCGDKDHTGPELLTPKPIKCSRGHSLAAWLPPA